MAARYQLSCPCGETLTVETSRAGEQVPCPSCGAGVEVPTLGKLRTFPEAEEQSPGGRDGEWTGRHAVGALGLLVGVAAGCIAIYMASQRQSETGIEADAKAETAELIDRLTPAGAWAYWQDFKAKVETYGFDSVRSYARLERQVESMHYRRLQWIWSAVAVAGGLVAAISWLWPSGRGRRSPP